ncbi:MAG TPA: ABC transporter substrate-binding protein [Microvirga sp.]|jgi:branched-chain amino acid transport system substrate-binding protein
MKKATALMGLIVGSMLTAAPALAQDQIYVNHNSYRTGAFSGSGIPFGNGVRDYFAMLNARDGGIGGVKINYEECETGYDTKKSVECYEQGRAKGTVVYTPWSTGAALAVIPRAHIDRIPILSMAYGLSAAADGNTFPWIFNPPVTYWDGASVFLRYIADREGGFDKLKGKTIGLVHLDAPFGKEPIPVLEAFAKENGFTLKLYPVPASEMQNQSSLWLSVRRDRPDWVYMMGWGAMNPTAVREASRSGFPMDRFVSVWWPHEDDIRPAGPAAKGFKVLTWHLVGQEYPAMQDILKHVVDKGVTDTQKDKVGDHAYGKGLYEGVLLAEGIRNAQRLTGKKVINAEDMRRGLEAIDITAARWKELGLEGFAGPIKLSCTDHNGRNPLYVLEWDGTKFVKVAEGLQPVREKVQPLVEEAAKAYATQNTGWPQRTEACDRAS